jgi:ketohexokinase
LNTPSRSRDGLFSLAREIQKHLRVSTVVVHPVTCALAVSQGAFCAVDGPFVEKPLITTGAGDHFNAGFCLGKLLGFDNAASLLIGVTASGFYVRSGQSPSIDDLVSMLRNWPSE